MTQPPDPGVQQPPPGNYPPPGNQPPPGNYPPPANYPPPGNFPPPQQTFPGMPPPPSGEYGGYGMPGTAVVPTGMYYDPQSGLTLPDGVVLASIGRRIGAFFLAIPLAIVTLGIGYAIWGLIVWAQGTTPALQVLGMRCWRPDDNQVPGWGWMALRNVIGCFIVERFITIIGVVSLILMCVNKDRKTIHDMMAGTVVLHDPSKVLVSRTS
jgi:uncharacterized RDD family membrane protein YckC